MDEAASSREDDVPAATTPTHAEEGALVPLASASESASVDAPTAHVAVVRVVAAASDLATDEHDDERDDERKRATTQPSAAMDASPPTPPSSTETTVVIDSTNDELFMRIVLKHEPYASSVRERIESWDTIAKTFATAGGKNISNRAAVTRRLGVLTIALFDSPPRLTPDLRAMVLEFNQRNCLAGYAVRLGGTFLNTLCTNATSGVAPMSESMDAPTNSRTTNLLQIHALEDELLMRLVMKFRPFDVDKGGKMSVWNRVADAYGTSLEGTKTARGRLESGQSVYGRINAATTALKNQAHLYHVHLPPVLRAMLVEFNILSFSPSSKLRSRTSDVTQALDNPVNNGSDTGNDDELFLRIVMENRPFESKAGGRLQVWDKIAEEFVAATSGEPMPKRGRSANVRMRTLVLRLLKTPRALAPTLRAGILEYYEGYCKMTQWPHLHNHQILLQLRKNVLGADAVEEQSGIYPRANRQNEDAPQLTSSTGVDVNVQIAPQDPLPGVAAVVSVNSVDTGAQRTSGSNPVSEHGDALPAKSSHSLVNASRSEMESTQGTQVTSTDASLMRIVLDTRPFFVDEPQDVLWNAVASRLTSKTQTLPGGAKVCTRSVRERVNWLHDVYTDENHEQHAQLSSALRSMLRDYTQVPHEKLQQLLASLHENTAPIEASQVAAAPTSLDDVLLREVLGARFKPGESKAAWQHVADTVNGRIGTTVFTNGKSCKRRVKKLIRLYRVPTKAKTLTATELEKVQQLDQVLQLREIEQSRETSLAAQRPVDDMMSADECAIPTGEGQEVMPAEADDNCEHSTPSSEVRTESANDDANPEAVREHDSLSISSKPILVPSQGDGGSPEMSPRATGHENFDSQATLPLDTDADSVEVTSKQCFEPEPEDGFDSTGARECSFLIGAVQDVMSAEVDDTFGHCAPSLDVHSRSVNNGTDFQAVLERDSLSTSVSTSIDGQFQGGGGVPPMSLRSDDREELDTVVPMPQGTDTHSCNVANDEYFEPLPVYEDTSSAEHPSPSSDAQEVRAEADAPGGATLQQSIEEMTSIDDFTFLTRDGQEVVRADIYGHSMPSAEVHTQCVNDDADSQAVREPESLSSCPLTPILAQSHGGSSEMSPRSDDHEALDPVVPGSVETDTDDRDVTSDETFQPEPEEWIYLSLPDSDAEASEVAVTMQGKDGQQGSDVLPVERDNEVMSTCEEDAAHSATRSGGFDRGERHDELRAQTREDEPLLPPDKSPDKSSPDKSSQDGICAAHPSSHRLEPSDKQCTHVAQHVSEKNLLHRATTPSPVHPVVVAVTTSESDEEEGVSNAHVSLGSDAASLDEQFVRLVLEVNPSSQPMGSKMAAWKKIAEMWTDQVGADTLLGHPTGCSAKSYFQYLSMASSKASQPRQVKMTHGLKLLLREYKASQKKLAAEANKRNRIEPTPASTTAPRPESSEHVTTARVRAETRSTASKRVRSASPTPTSARPSKKACRPVVRDRDEAVMRRLIALRPFWAHTTSKMPLFAYVAQSTNSSQIRTGAAVEDLVERLTEVGEDPSHSQHTRLGSSLLGLLHEFASISDEELQAAYHRACDAVQKEGKLSTKDMTFDDIVVHEARRLRPRWSPTQWDALAKRLNTRCQANVFTSGQACIDRVKDLLRVFHSGNDDAFITLTTQQQQLLREFEDVDGRRNSMRVASTVDASPALTVANRKRKTPQAPAKSSTASSSARSSDRDRDTRSKRRRAIEQETHDNSSSEEEAAHDETIFCLVLASQPFHADNGLKRDAWDAVARDVNKQLGLGKHGAFKNGPKLETYIQQVLDRLAADPASLPMRLRELATQYNAMVSSPTISKKPKPSRTRSPDTILASTATRVSSSVVTREEVPEQALADEMPRNTTTARAADLQAGMNLLRASLDRLSESLTAAGGIHGRSLTIPSGQAAESAPINDREPGAMCTENVQLLEQLEIERRESNAHHQALVELLRAEREAQRRETQAMLDTIERERMDRRDEFVAMVNLISHTVHGTEHADD